MYCYYYGLPKKAFQILSTKLSCTLNLIDHKPFHVVWDFRLWDVMTKVCYFLMVQTHNLRTLEVEHDLETCSRPWSTWILTLWASQGPQNWQWSIKEQHTFGITFHGRKSQTTWKGLTLQLFQSIKIEYWHLERICL